ncbi:hypothetical protein, partial [Flavobacterium sp.]|uniref:hypothetical protein n=1 Tax=Flavobacterium sp. TaxID=239 RepID=UPI00374D92B1
HFAGTDCKSALSVGLLGIKYFIMKVKIILISLVLLFVFSCKKEEVSEFPFDRFVLSYSGLRHVGSIKFKAILFISKEDFLDSIARICNPCPQRYDKILKA